MPPNMEALLNRYDQILIPELNCGQLRLLIDSQFKVNTIGLNKVKGKPFAVSEVVEKIEEVTGKSS